MGNNGCCGSREGVPKELVVGPLPGLDQAVSAAVQAALAPAAVKQQEEALPPAPAPVDAWQAPAPVPAAAAAPAATPELAGRPAPAAEATAALPKAEAGGQASQAAEEGQRRRRRDPETKRVVTLGELQEHYRGRYSNAEIMEYWRDYCEPVKDEAKQQWIVVGGGDKGGILVRTGKDLRTPELGRLTTGAKVQELAREGERVQYKLIAGTGPPTGWISRVNKGREMLARPT